MHGQRERVVGARFADREISLLVAQVRKALLQVHRNGIVDLCSDTRRLQMRLQLVAPLAADDELVVDVPRARRRLVREYAPPR